MADRPGSGAGTEGDETFARHLAAIGEKSHQILSEFLERRGEQQPGGLDPLNVGAAFLELTARMMTDPARLGAAQTSLWNDYLTLWQASARRQLGQPSEPVAAPAGDDRRFRHPDWEDNPVFDYIKQSYLLTADWVQRTVAGVEGLDEKTKHKVRFYTRQFVDAMAPSNFVLTNPEVLRATLDSRGENLLKGLDNLLDDLVRGRGRLAIRQTADDFRLGENVALSPGSIVFQNDLMQLIQYAPSTKSVYQRPLLIVPPWINKFYILDLRPENSFIRWAVARGYTVFVVSWVNPDERLADKTFADYMREGVLAALDAIADATGERHATAIGYCLGGTLMAASLAWMAARGDDRIKAVTSFATLVDFAEAGDLAVFIDDEQLAYLEARMARTGTLEGRDMANVFNMLRANDLIWSFVVNNYLLGKEALPFDLLFWNADSTRMPRAMHSFYLRNMYQENLLSRPAGIALDGEAIDLGRISVPSYVLAGKEDHIAPWTSCFAATRLYGGAVRFVLARSGHIAGVVNPPSAGRYAYWTSRRRAATPEDWLEGAAEHNGSWWPDWHAWLKRHAGPRVAARVPGDGKLRPLEAAPGSYVRVCAD